MLKKLKIFKSFEEADTADRVYYLSLSPTERLAVAEKLRREYETLRYGTQQRLRRIFRIVKQA